MRPVEALPDAKDQKQGNRAGRQARRKEQRSDAPYQRGARRGCLREPLGAHHHHDLVDEYRLAEPDPRRQQEERVDNVSRDRNLAPDRHTTLERRRNMFHMRRHAARTAFPAAPATAGRSGWERSPFI